MKTLLFTLSLAVAGVGSTYAQSSTVARGAVVGSIAGALIGGHNHDRWAEGAVIGAAAGALIGAAVDQPRTVVVTTPPPVVCAPAPRAVIYVRQPAPPVRVVYVRRPSPASVVVVRGNLHRGRYASRPVYVAPVVYYGR
jgi:hypothetical protein